MKSPKVSKDGLVAHIYIMNRENLLHDASYLRLFTLG